ncbi:O-antigen polymerase [Vibrio sp. F74]|uniref:O-antigen polymerase n=1 Tax=Vibrio sp. F74 TaxID=700020 RepID=UPI0035F5E75D
MILLSPLFIYFFSWILVLFLYSLKMTSNLTYFSWEGMILIILNMFSMVLFYFFSSLGRKSRITLRYFPDEYVKTVSLYVKGLGFIWFVGTFFEIYYSKGVPLLWTIMGSGRLYTDFGIPSFHGVMNACFLQLVTGLACLGIKKRNKIHFIIILLLLVWPILMFGRGILLSALVQIFVVSAFYIKIKIRHYIYLTILAVLFILGFGVIGDLRQNANPFEYLVVSDYEGFFKALPTGFLWFYVYLTAGISNLFYNLPILDPVYSMTYSFSNMLPTIVRTFFGLSERNDLFIFVDHNLNTSTIYAGFVSDFWILGGFVMFGVVQLFSCIAFQEAKNGKPWGVFSYTVFFQILLFSIFYDMFFLLPTLFQLFLCLFLWFLHNFFTKVGNKNGHNIIE